MVIGGDGMVHLGVQAVAETETALGIIPAGTGNDVARYFDLPAQGPGGGGRRGDRGDDPDGRPRRSAAASTS